MADDKDKCPKAMYFLLDGSNSVEKNISYDDWGVVNQSENYLSTQLQTIAGLLRNQAFIQKQLDGGPLLVALGTFSDDHTPRVGWQKITSIADAQRVAGMVDQLVGLKPEGGTDLGKGIVGATAQFYHPSMPEELKIDLANASRSIHAVTDGLIARASTHPDQMNKADQQLQAAINASSNAINFHNINVNAVLIDEAFDRNEQDRKAIAERQLRQVASAGRGNFSYANWDNFSENIRKDIKCNLLLSELAPLLEPVNGHVSKVAAKDAARIMQTQCPVVGSDHAEVTENIEVLQNVAAALSEEQRMALFAESTDIDISSVSAARG